MAYPNKTMARDSKKSGGPRTICTSARVVCNHHIGRARSSNESASSAVSPSGSCKGPARSPILRLKIIKNRVAVGAAPDLAGIADLLTFQSNVLEACREGPSSAGFRAY